MLAGTSGYAFKEWKGSFYPEDLKDDGMLGFYAGKFPTVEINNTFYRLPKEHVLTTGHRRCPETFTFAIKASQRITHSRAAQAGDARMPVEFLLKMTTALGGQLGPILFQLPPNLKKDATALQAFLAMLPPDRKYTIEFRNRRWFDDETYDALACARHRAVRDRAAGVRDRRSSRPRHGDMRGCTASITARPGSRSGRGRSRRSRGARRTCTSSTMRARGRGRPRSRPSRGNSIGPRPADGRDPGHHFGVGPSRRLEDVEAVVGAFDPFHLPGRGHRRRGRAP